MTKSTAHQLNQMLQLSAGLRDAIHTALAEEEHHLLGTSGGAAATSSTTQGGGGGGDYTEEVLQLCILVEDSMTSCLAIPQLAPHVNTDGVATLVQGHRSAAKKQHTTSPLVTEAAAAAELPLIEDSFLAPVCPSIPKENEVTLLKLAHTIDKLQEFAKESEQPRSLCPTCTFAQVAMGQLTDLLRAEVALTQRQDQFGDEQLRPESPIGIFGITLSHFAQRSGGRSGGNTTFPAAESSSSSSASHNNTAPPSFVDRDMLEHAGRAERGPCLCITDEAVHFREQVMEALLEAATHMKHHLQVMKSYAQRVFAWRLALQQFHVSRCEELRQLADWYQGCLEANTQWNIEAKRRRHFKAVGGAFQNELQVLQQLMAEENASREAFIQRHGGFLPQEGFPSVGQPPSPVLIECGLVE